MVALALDPPPSSRRSNNNRPSGAGRYVLVGVALLGTLGGGFWLGRATAPGGRLSAEPAATAQPPTAAAAAPDAATGANVPPPHAPVAGGTPGVAAPESAAPSPGAPPAPAAAPVAPPGSSRVSVTLQGALEESIRRALPQEDRAIADELTQVVNRLLVWDLQVARDGRKGDRLDVVFTRAVPAAPGLPAVGEPVVEAVRYASSKLGRVFAAYRYQPQGARWARYYREDGTELEEALLDGPIAQYEQVTSLLRDGRRHKGVDFKAPVGSPVFAPFDGVVERRNWNFRGNGNCLDLRDPATGRHAIFLHLDVVSKDMNPGRRVKKGEQVAASGNSGRSFAPHLHYQLEASDGRVLDPYEVHRTERRALAAGERPAFDAARGKLEAVLGASSIVIPAASGVPAQVVPAQQLAAPAR
jgi:murein DD-endopeptidase MepM/ murein hydrolase activator NlpD